MKLFLILLIVVIQQILLLLCCGENVESYILRRKVEIEQLSITELTPSRKNEYHTVVFAIKLRNRDRLEQVLYDVSDPLSENYGKHWTREQVMELIGNEAGSSVVEEYLRREGIMITRKTPNGEYLTGYGRIDRWEKIFQTRFHEYVRQAKVFHRALEYSLSSEINDHIEDVFRVTELPPETIPFSINHVGPASLPGSFNFTNKLTPEKLVSHYHIDTSLGSSSTSQATIQCFEQSVSPSDLVAFQEYFQIPKTLLHNNLGNHINNQSCSVNTNNCDEANLSNQYLTAIGRQITSSNYYFDDTCDMTSIASQLTALMNPPKVIMIGYGVYEASAGLSAVRAFNTAAMMLGTMGVTLLASSGNDGAGGDSTCGYKPIFPASSPFVTTVGATQGPERNQVETTCQSDNNGGITSGGGFSIYSSLPSWQTTVVTNYFNAVAQTNKSPRTGYSSTGRGYPDISAMGNQFTIVANNAFLAISGTAGSTAVVAGMVSLVNAVRAQANHPTLGFLNPFLYAQSSSFVWDITTGNNLCTANANICCQQGFHAASGWDPVTGLGVLNFTAFSVAARNLQLTFSPTVSPTRRPTLAPSTRAPTTAAPTLAPTMLPPIIEFQARQVLREVNYTALSLNTSLYERTIRKTVLAVLTNEISINVTAIDFLVADTTSTTSTTLSTKEEVATPVPPILQSLSSFSLRSHHLQAIPARQLSTTINLSNCSVILRYNVSIQAQSLNYTDYYNQLTFAVTTGIFTSQLRIIAFQNQATGFSQSRSNSVAIALIAHPSSAPTLQPTVASVENNSEGVYSTYLIPIVLGGMFLIVLLIVMMYLAIVYRKYESNVQMSKIHAYSDQE